MRIVLLVFPFIVISMTMLGFACGIPVTRAHFILSTFLTLCFVACYAEQSNRVKVSLAWLFLLLASVLIASLPMMYTTTDGANCHRPAAFLLAWGWNPVYETEYSDLYKILNSHFDVSLFKCRPQHIGYVPRAAWIYSAVLYKFFGFVEVGDSLNIYAAIALFFVSMEWVRNFPRIGTKLRVIFSLLIVLCPYSVSGAFGGTIDSSVYSFLVCSCLEIDHYVRHRKTIDLVAAIMCATVACGIKLVALPWVILMTCAYAVRLGVHGSWRQRIICLLAPVVVIVLVFLVNVTPYLTSAYHHSSPFYPTHSFDKTEKVADNMTYDFDVMNKDAQAMGYWGRFSYAYVSKVLTKFAYRKMLKTETFDPQWQLFSDVDGLGMAFRLFFWMSLIGLFLVRDRGVKLLAGVMIVSLFLYPAKYMGYGRYVAPIYIVPLLVAIGLAAREVMRSQAVLMGGAMIIYTCSLLIGRGSLLFLPYLWLTSVQNLQTVLMLEKDPEPIVATDFYYCAHALKFDCNPHIRLIPMRDMDCIGLCHSYGPCNLKYLYLTKDEIPGFRDYYFQESKSRDEKVELIMNKSFSQIRRRGIEDFFVKEFLPKEIVLVPLRFYQTIGFRWRQFSRHWKVCG